ncbi:hypothetical protein JCR33_01950 [Acuticoccus sp. 2012]|uniref:Uncharacterized protein n=2 Tax=Acuticoccus mangrovi TaxID=2796142 RepID=A0A934IN40_9HYPH|nr:hypothetical protein [Acuticoccus mangrovi]
MSASAPVALRDPECVMRLARLGSSHPTRLSFLYAMLRRLQREGWTFDRPLFQLDDRGVGRAVYTVRGPERTYSLVAFAHDLPDHLRSDRVIATRWDATFALHDGVPSAEDLDRLEANVPLQEAGRISPRELTLARANRSVRLFEHVVESLAAGRQPDPAEVAPVGYLMRTTAVYGSGKFGAADRALIADRAELKGPFQAEMLTVWLIRAFTVDLVEHLAAVRGGDRAVPLDPAMRRRFGVGNSTGLGMAPFLVNHPVLLNNWVMAREKALAAVRALPDATPRARAAFADALAAARANAAAWRSDHPLQIEKLADLRHDLALVEASADAHLCAPSPWDALWRWGEATLSLEGQEALLALLLEPHGDVVDALCETMDADEGAHFRIDGAMTVGALRDLLAGPYRWALAPDYASREESARFWYVSEEKLEPRLGERHEEDGAEREDPLGVGRDVAALAAALAKRPAEEPLATFLMAEPGHRHVVRRVQIGARHPYAEVHDNLLSSTMMPIDLLRAKLAFFGATRFDPRSDRWVRIALFQEAPFPHEHLEATV